MKNILTKFDSNIYFLFFLISYAITGNFREFFVVFSLVIVHEIGHLLMALLFKWEVDKIYIYPFGGITKFNTKVNTSIKEEFLVLINGFVFQIIYFLIITLLYQNHYIRESTYNMFSMYHYSLMYFNLLPIYPLDGSKIIKLLNENYISFEKTFSLIIIISSIFLSILLYKFWNLNVLFICIYLLIFNIKLIKDKKYILNQFLIERMMYNFKYKKSIIISSVHDMKKNKMHIFKKDNRYYTEKEYINKKFDNRL